MAEQVDFRSTTWNRYRTVYAEIYMNSLSEAGLKKARELIGNHVCTDHLFYYAVLDSNINNIRKTRGLWPLPPQSEWPAGIMDRCSKYFKGELEYDGIYNSRSCKTAPVVVSKESGDDIPTLEAAPAIVGKELAMLDVPHAAEIKEMYVEIKTASARMSAVAMVHKLAEDLKHKPNDFILDLCGMALANDDVDTFLIVQPFAPALQPSYADSVLNHYNYNTVLALQGWGWLKNYPIRSDSPGHWVFQPAIPPAPTTAPKPQTNAV